MIDIDSEIQELIKTPFEECNLKKLSSYLEKIDIDETNDFGITVLTFASYFSDYKMVNFLLEQGASIFSKDIHHNTALHNCCFNSRDRINIMNLLLENYAQIDVQNKYGNSALHNSFNKPDCVRVLMQYNAKTNLQNNLGQTVLHLLAQNKIDEFSFNIVEKLAKHKLDFNLKDNQGNSALYTLCKHNIKEDKMIELFIKSGAKIEKESHIEKIMKEHKKDSLINFAKEFEQIHQEDKKIRFTIKRFT